MKEFPATLTSKGQITIPQKIREILQINSGDIIRFIINEDDTIRIEKGIIICPVCKGEKKIGINSCFACNKTGTVNPSSSVLEYLMQIKKYNIQFSIISEEVNKNTLRKFPLIKLYDTHNNYPKEKIYYFQDFLQWNLIREFANKNIILGNKEGTLNADEILQSFKTEEIKKYFKKSILHNNTLNNLLDYI